MARREFWQRVIDDGHELDDIPDFSALSIITGISTRSLSDMASGFVKPSARHLEAIEAVVGPKVAKHFNTHKKMKPHSYKTAPAGAVPDGYKLSVSTRVKDLQPGYLLPYDRGLSAKRNRIVWLELEEMQPFEGDGAYFLRMCNGDIEIRCNADTVIRSAIPANNDSQ